MGDFNRGLLLDRDNIDMDKLQGFCRRVVSAWMASKMPSNTEGDRAASELFWSRRSVVYERAPTPDQGEGKLAMSIFTYSNLTGKLDTAMSFLDSSDGYNSIGEKQLVL